MRKMQLLLKKILLMITALWGPILFAQQPFIIGDIMGQFGNQLFQIAATTSLALDNDAVAIFPSLKTETNFNVPINYKMVFYHLNVDEPQKDTSCYYLEPKFTYSPISYRPNMLIRGWFQSDKYFRHHAKEISELFAPPAEILDYLNNKYAHIIQDPDTVAIHYRSYDKEDPEHKVYIKNSLDYYQRAMAQFSKDSHFIVFSNDIEWCKANFPNLPGNFLFIEGEQHYHDFYLMSLCKHNIICNSSFSWWAAYLNPNPQKRVIAPAEWFNPSYQSDTSDLIPDGWLLVSTLKHLET